MKKNLTEIVFIIDRSGSMAGLETDTIGGFNAMLEKQKKTEGEAYLSTVLFNHSQFVLHDRVPVEQVKPLTSEDYYVGGSTALLDAIGGAVHHIANIHKYAREEDRPEKTIFVITTDGMENASRMYNYSTVKRMVARQQEEYGWEFLFLGANIDAAATAESVGIHADHAAEFHNDSIGTRTNYAAMSETIADFRTAEAPCISENWKASIEKDFKKRKKH